MAGIINALRLYFEQYGLNPTSILFLIIIGGPLIYLGRKLVRWLEQEAYWRK